MGVDISGLWVLSDLFVMNQWSREFATPSSLNKTLFKNLKNFSKWLAAKSITIKKLSTVETTKHTKQNSILGFSMQA